MAKSHRERITETIVQGHIYKLVKFVKATFNAHDFEVERDGTKSAGHCVG
jgi:hypothetical protein